MELCVFAVETRRESWDGCDVSCACLCDVRVRVRERDVMALYKMPLDIQWQGLRPSHCYSYNDARVSTSSYTIMRLACTGFVLCVSLEVCVLPPRGHPIHQPRRTYARADVVSPALVTPHPRTCAWQPLRAVLAICQPARRRSRPHAFVLRMSLCRTSCIVSKRHYEKT